MDCPLDVIGGVALDLGSSLLVSRLLLIPRATIRMYFYLSLIESARPNGLKSQL